MECTICGNFTNIYLLAYMVDSYNVYLIEIRNQQKIQNPLKLFLFFVILFFKTPLLQVQAGQRTAQSHETVKSGMLPDISRVTLKI